MHPLSRNSDARRRWLINRQAAATAEVVPAPPAQIAPAADEPRFVTSAPCEGMLAIRHLLTGMQPLTWVFTGDSITHGAVHTEGHRSFSEHLGERVRWELRRYLDVIINTGVSGERSAGLLKNLEWRVLRFRPEVVFLMIGTNDATAGPEGREPFRKNLRAILGRIKEAGIIPVLQTPNPVYPPAAESRADLPAYVETIRNVAARLQVPLVDHWDHWTRLKPTAEALLDWLHDGAIHPNAYGHREMTRLICHELGIYDATSPTCRREVP